MIKKLFTLIGTLLITQSLTASFVPNENLKTKLITAINNSSFSTFKHITNNPQLKNAFSDLKSEIETCNDKKLEALKNLRNSKAHDPYLTLQGSVLTLGSVAGLKFLFEDQGTLTNLATIAATIGFGYHGLKKLYNGINYQKFINEQIKENEQIGQLLNNNPYASDQSLPIIFHPNYDIGFFGIEKVHPFDSKKYGKVFSHIVNNILGLTEKDFVKPQHEVSQNDLLEVHAPTYLESLKNSKIVEKIAEIPMLRILPNFLVQSRLLSPMRYATQGTIDAAQLALKTGVAINLGGGYHHANRETGGGFCVYADIPLAMLKLREQNPNLKIMYIDLDAHQGNGVESFFVNKDPNTFIVDCYNEKNYPFGHNATEAINKKILAHDIYCENHKQRGRGQGHPCKECNATYLKTLTKALEEVKTEFKPDFIFYNAGTDCFEEDAIGAMALTKQGIIDRDQIVFEFAKKQNTPICMTLSGGYSQKSAKIIGESIVNLYNKNLLKHQ